MVVSQATTEMMRIYVRNSFDVLNREWDFPLIQNLFSHSALHIHSGALDRKWLKFRFKFYGIHLKNTFYGSKTRLMI